MKRQIGVAKTNDRLRFGFYYICTVSVCCRIETINGNLSYHFPKILYWKVLQYRRPINRHISIINRRIDHKKALLWSTIILESTFIEIETFLYTSDKFCRKSRDSQNSSIEIKSEYDSRTRTKTEIFSKKKSEKTFNAMKLFGAETRSSESRRTKRQLFRKVAEKAPKLTRVQCPGLTIYKNKTHT